MIGFMTISEALLETSVILWPFTMSIIAFSAVGTIALCALHQLKKGSLTLGLLYLMYLDLYSVFLRYLFGWFSVFLLYGSNVAGIVGGFNGWANR